MRSRLLMPPGTSLMPLATLGLLAACTSSNSPLSPTSAGSTSLSISFAATGAAAVTAGGNAVLVGTAADTMVITKVQMVLENVKLRLSGVTACPDSITASVTRGRSHDSGGCSRLDLGPMLLDLPLGGTSASPLSVTVPAGTYRRLEFELEDVSTSASAPQASKDFLTAHPEFRDVTVKVVGTYRGTPFSFLSRASAEVEFEFDPALVVQAAVNDNITIELDLAAWFRNSAGAILAPTVANQARIDQNIIASFTAFGDRDRDGNEDTGRRESHGQNGDGNN